MKVNSTWFHLGVKDPLSDSRRKHNPLGVVSEREKKKTLQIEIRRTTRCDDPL